MKTTAMLLVVSLFMAAVAVAAEKLPDRPESAYAGRGYELLSHKPYLPSPDFSWAVFDETWKVWEEPARSQAEKASPEERRAMAFSRYGLTTAPGDPSGNPQQYVVDAQGNWTMNCLTCHQGKVAGKVYPGLPNSLIALQTLVEDVRKTKIKMKQKLTRFDIGAAFIPMGTTNGSTNAVMFGVALLGVRDAELHMLPDALPPPMVHHDHDAPPWWNFKKKTHLYSDGFAAKDPRPLMQFMLIPENGPEKFNEWEPDFREIYAWLDSLEAPKYPFEIDGALAAKGEAIFNKNCSECHGTYGPQGNYPNKIVSIDEVGTDRVRLDALTPAHRSGYNASWFGHFGQHDVVADPGGYVAPPLDGIWASAPYFHNGAVPTLWHVMHSAERPTVWSRSEDGYDRTKVGLDITAYDATPEVKTPAERRRYYDTTKFGKSKGGHEFPDALTEEEKTAVLEYLKTL